MVLFFWNGFAPDSLFTYLPIIASIPSYHVWCQVVAQKAIFIFVSLRTLLFVLNKTDSKLLQFDYLSRVRIKTDVHFKQYLCFLPFQSFFRNAYAHTFALSDLTWSVSRCDVLQMCCIAIEQVWINELELELELVKRLQLCHMMANADNLITN